MYDNKKKVKFVYFNKKNNKNKKLNLYIYITLISIFIFFIYSNIKFKKSPKTKNKNFIEDITNDNRLPPKPKEKWKYIHKLENL